MYTNEREFVIHYGGRRLVHKLTSPVTIAEWDRYNSSMLTMDRNGVSADRSDAVAVDIYDKHFTGEGYGARGVLFAHKCEIVRQLFFEGECDLQNPDAILDGGELRVDISFNDFSTSNYFTFPEDRDIREWRSVRSYRSMRGGFGKPDKVWSGWAKIAQRLHVRSEGYEGEPPIHHILRAMITVVSEMSVDIEESEGN